VVDGGCVAMAATLKTLHLISDDVAHCFVQTPRHPAQRDLYPAGTRFALDDASSFINTDVSAIGALSAFIRGKNYNLSRFYSATFGNELKAYLTAEQPEIIVLESLFLVPYLKTIRSVSAAKIVLRAHNIEHQLWEQQADQASSLKKTYLNHLARTLKREEIRGWKQVDLIWAISDEDAQQIRDFGIKTPVTTIPVAMETGTLLPDYGNPDFFHLGSLNWEPNKVAVKRLLTDIWPQFNTTSQSRLHIAGSFSEDFKMDFVAHVQMHGFVESAEQFMLQHGTLVAPVVSGSGVRIKLLEALSLGIPCITTRLGAAGIQHAEEQLKIARTDEEWLEALKEFTASEELRRNYGEKGKAYMQKYHSFTAVKAQMITSLGN